jgi:hypothetical protein
MSKNEDEFRVGYNNYETKDEAVKEATRRSLREFDNTSVYKKIGEAKFTLDKLNPDLVTYSDIQ